MNVDADFEDFGVDMSVEEYVTSLINSNESTEVA